ncbi:MAG TPA: ATP-binding protein [Candidatus Blautia faecigallinarum]|uniref:ATP-binding protein n=1 Tax=Candidatus Blautia faecigallinarum TaxID=2838488 RepID=A0A9D2DQR7_9FIRM|nr:ATP-binding protein [Candidatus Blautia faecigallinarum]
MGRFVNPRFSAFQDAVNSKIYVDKTELLEYTNSVIDTTSKFICNSRPRRFGKSITADMLTAYYSRECRSEEMFSKLAIGQSGDFKKHLNQYDVIHLDIQWCLEPAGSPEKIISFITEQTLQELKEYYPQTFSEKISSLPDALSCINASTGKKFIIIMDEWDVLIRDEAANQTVQEEYISFLRGMFKGSEPSKYIHLAYLTGILPIKKVQTQSALNNFDEFTMLDAGILSPFIGFTEDEVQKLCLKYNRDFPQVKNWYDGYQLGEYHIYNPRAVVSVMLRGSFQNYWSKTGTYEAIVPLINMNFDGLKTAIMEILSGGSTQVDISSFQNDMVHFSSKDDVLTCLIHLGYLAYDQKKQTAFLPNEEIRQELANAVKYKKWDEFIAFHQESSALLEATLDLDGDTVAAEIEKIHSDYTSVIQYNNENSLSSVLAIGYLSAMQYYFKPIRELPTGRGFSDFVFLPKPEYRQDYPALVVELKWNQNAQTALKQIKEKKYPASIKDFTGNILLVGISYNKKTKQHSCMIEKYQK